MQTNLFLATVLTTQMLVNAQMTTDIHTSDFFSITDWNKTTRSRKFKNSFVRGKKKEKPLCKYYGLLAAIFHTGFYYFCLLK